LLLKLAGAPPGLLLERLLASLLVAFGRRQIDPKLTAAVVATHVRRVLPCFRVLVKAAIVDREPDPGLRITS